MGLFSKKEPEEMYTALQVRDFIKNALAQEQFDFSALWEEQQQDTGLLQKLAPLLGGVISIITLVVLLTK